MEAKGQQLTLSADHLGSCSFPLWSNFLPFETGLRSSGWPRTYYAAEDDLEIVIPLPQPESEGWNPGLSAC